MTKLDPAVLAQHWFSRITENGVPVQDYRDTTARITTWAQWCTEWEATGDLRMTDAAEAERAGAVLTAAELRFIAAMEYHFGKFLFVHDVAEMRRVHAKAAAAYRAAMGDLPWPGRALDVEHDGHTLRGVLRLPGAATDRPVPAVVVVPGLDATKEEMHRLEEVFLRRGMATFSLDGPGQGEAEFHQLLEPAWERVATSTVDTLVGEPGIDGDRLALVGVSLGGYFAARAVAVEPRLRAGASIGGCFSMGESWPNLSFLTRQAFAVRSGASANDNAAQARAHEFTVANTPPMSDTPFLIVHGGNDRLFDLAQAERLRDHFGSDAELVVEPHGNHVLHNLAYRARPRAADWVAERLITRTVRLHQ
jgi:alpha-beta hydrolase superfamily lysophospholipase